MFVGYKSCIDVAEEWYLLDNGDLIFLQVSECNGPEMDRKYMSEEEYESFYSEGWIGYLDYTVLYPDLSYDGGLIPFKEGWTVDDAVSAEFDRRINCRVLVADEFELRSAVENQDEERIQEILVDCEYAQEGE